MSKMYEILLSIGGKLSNSLPTAVTGASKSIAGLQKSADNANKGASSLKGGILSLKNSVLGVAAAVAGGGGLFELASGAIEAGNKTYELSQKMHVSSAEAANLNKMLKLTNTDTQPFISTMLKLDKGLETAGKSGNATTKALAKFGIDLKDAHDNLLPMNDQLAQLAAGYKKATENGQEEEFTAEVLGAKGSALVGILADYNEVAEQAAQTKGIGINPELAHKVYLQMQGLKSQMSQFGLVAGNAIMPIVANMLPSLQSGFSNIALFIKDHQPDIQNVVGSISDIGKTVITDVMPVVKDLGGIVAKDVLPLLVDGFKGAGAIIKEFGGHLNIVIPVVGGLAAAVEAYKIQQMFANKETIAGMVITSLSKAWGTAATLISLLREGESLAAVAQLALNMAMKDNPIGVMCTLIGLLITSGIALYMHWDTVSAKLSDVWISIENFFKSGVNNVIGYVNMLIDGLNKIPGVNVPHIKELAMSYKDAKNNVGDYRILDAASIGNNAAGTNNWRGGLTWVGEKGPELLDLPRGSSITPAGKTNRLLNKGLGEGMNITYAPVYNLPPGTSEQDIKNAANDSQREFARQMQIWLVNKNRVAFHKCF